MIREHLQSDFSSFLRLEKPGAHQLITVLDFGSQYTQLIARRLRELSVYSEIFPFNTPVQEIKARRPEGIILSGGPASVSNEDSPQCDPEIFDLGIPVLGICYGMQIMADMLGGSVARASEREYGHATVKVEGRTSLFESLPDQLRVWASHGDFLEAVPPGFSVTATSSNAPIAAMADHTRNFYALLFHPEVVHTEHGVDILRNYSYKICGCTGDWTISSFIEETIKRIQNQVGTSSVLCALSGGVDSTVTALLIHRSIGDRLTCVFVDNGVLRHDEAFQLKNRFVEKLQIPVVFKDASKLFLDRLSGVVDPEEKRKIIGEAFIEVFDETARDLGEFDFLAQGTLYPDVIESVSVVGPSAVIKSHHNVGGLPEKMSFKLIEPLRNLFKDEVRVLGQELGLDREFVSRQPFPGPGLAIRILGEVTKDRLEVLRKADVIVIEEIKRQGWYDRLWQSFAVLLPIRSVGVMGDERTYEHTLALRAVESQDGMTADWAHLPYDLLEIISSRIVNEVNGINRVVYDVSAKPPSTIEWE